MHLTSSRPRSGPAARLALTLALVAGPVHAGTDDPPAVASADPSALAAADRNHNLHPDRTGGLVREGRPTAVGRPWSIARRVIARGPTSGPEAPGRAWQVDYLLVNEGPETILLPPESVAAEIDGWVSNSRAAGHSTPRRARHVLAASASGLGSGQADLIESRDESRRCRERASIAAWAASEGDTPPARLHPEASGPPAPSPLVIPPGDALRVQLRLEHDHFLYGPYEPLLGAREIALRLGPATVRDTLPLDRDPGPEPPAPAWAEFIVPPDRRDPQVYASAPESLHLAAHRPGHASFRMTGPVRYGTRMRLSFWYLIAPGTEGDTRAAVTQVKSGPAVHRTLYDGEHLLPLNVEGRWTRVVRIIRTEPEATQLTLEFKLTGDIGELWIDDVALEPLDDAPAGP